MDYHQQAAPYNTPPAVSKEQTTWAMVAHLSGLLTYVGIPFGHIIAPLAIWLMNRDTMPFVDDQAKESLNFQLTVSLYALACIPFVFVVIGIFFLIALGLFHVVASIIAAVKAQQGIAYRYPMTIRFV